MRRAFVDTGAWFAYTNKKDPDHKAVSAALMGFDGRLVTSNFVFDETVTLCRYKLGNAIALKVGDALLSDEQLDVVGVAAADEREAWKLFKKRADREYSFTDCTSFVLMRRLGLTQVVATDGDFRTEGFEVLPAS